jgi:hypothetical protein
MYVSNFQLRLEKYGLLLKDRGNDRSIVKMGARDQKSKGKWIWIGRERKESQKFK